MFINHKAVIVSFTAMLLFSSTALSQKGVDSQTQKIKDDGNKVTTRSTDATRSFDWGKGKTKVRDRLPELRNAGRGRVMSQST